MTSAIVGSEASARLTGHSAVGTELQTPMGMFDELRCEAPLPDNPESGEAWFQTKSFPDPCLRRYTITRAGRLVDARGNDLEPEGYLTFYTLDDASGQWREYRARFVRGDLQAIERVARADADRRHDGLASFRWFDTPSYLVDDPDE